MGKKYNLDISVFGLHVLAMLFMLCDHLWGTLLPAQEWLTCIGRLAFPIFAFLIVEGYVHTKNLKRYMIRLFICAVLSEVPFDLMCSGTAFYPYHQNVIWTFLISLFVIIAVEKMALQYSADCCTSQTMKIVAMALKMFVFMGIVMFGFFIGYAAMVDYYGVGVGTVLVFYVFRKRNWACRICQIICLYILHVKLLGGYYYEVHLFGHVFEIVQQGIALIALVPIWIYQGRQGLHTKTFQYFCYVFYPAHMLLLSIIRKYI